jgi:heme/copper-type cytochrome/quinol oxidase subunit 3
LVHNAGVYLMRWFVLLATIIVSGLLLAWAAQNASLSASPVSDPEPYRVAAVLLWDATILSLTAGTCGFFVLSSRRREPRKMRLAWMAMVFYAIFGGGAASNHDYESPESPQ